MAAFRNDGDRWTVKGTACITLFETEKQRMKRIILLMLLLLPILKRLIIVQTNYANVNIYVDTCHLSNLIYLQQQLKEG